MYIIHVYHFFNKLANLFFLEVYPTVLVGVCASVWSEGRELPVVGALATFLCRWVWVPMGVSLGCKLGSWDELWQIFSLNIKKHSWNTFVAVSPRYYLRGNLI